MTDTYRGVPYPSNWANMDYYRQRAWKMGVLSAVGSLGLQEAQALAAELEAVNGWMLHSAVEENAEAAYQVYRVIGRETKMHPSETHELAKKIVAALVEAGWGDLSGAKIQLTQQRMELQDAVREANEALRRATSGES